MSLRREMKDFVEGYKKDLTEKVKPLLIGKRLYQSMGDRKPIDCGIIQECKILDLLEYENFRVRIITDKKDYHTFGENLNFDKNPGYGYFVEKV